MGSFVLATLHVTDVARGCQTQMPPNVGDAGQIVLPSSRHTYSYAQIVEHNKKGDTWLVIDGSVRRLSSQH